MSTGKMDRHDAAVATSVRYAIAVSKYNEAVTSKLLSGAMETLTEAGVPAGLIDVYWAPGAFELPLLVQSLARSKHHAAILALGAVIRGETTHDQHINASVSHALMQISLAEQKPVLFGLLTCDNLEQAFARAGGAHGNKGSECALAAMQLLAALAHVPHHG